MATRKTNPQKNIKSAQGSLFTEDENSTPHKVERPWAVLEKLKPEEECTKSHVSLFSGCGGFDLGLRQAGFRTIFANDFNEDACTTYRENLGEIELGDIWEVKYPKLRKRLDVLTAGFPCQPFSNAGSRRGTKDDRGTLYQAAIRGVEKLKPRAVIFENVRGLLSFKKGKKLLIEEICENLGSLGYDVVFSLVDASQHHVPQRRLRLFIVGLEKNRRLGSFTFPNRVVREDLTLKHTIFDLNNKFKNQTELMQLNPQAVEIGKLVPEGGSWKDIAYEKLPPRLQKIADNMAKYHSPNFYRRFHRTEVAGTITAAFKPENAGVWHPSKKRIMSVREIARIQSFPDWFEFLGRTVKSKYQQIGNAVPPRYAYELGLQLKKALDGEKLRQDLEYYTLAQFVKNGQPLKTRDKGVLHS